MRRLTGLLAVAMGVLVGAGAMPTGPCGPPVPPEARVPAALEPADPLVTDPASAGTGPLAADAFPRWSGGRTEGRIGPDQIMTRPIAGWSTEACAPAAALAWEGAASMQARPADVLHGLPPTERLHSPLDHGGTEYR